MQRMAKHADLICASFTLRFFGSLGFSRFLTGCHYRQQLIFRKSKDLTNRRAGDRVVDIGDVHKKIARRLPERVGIFAVLMVRVGAI